jgi:hypothetical protein
MIKIATTTGCFRSFFVNRQFGQFLYYSILIRNLEEGYVGYELHRFEDSNSTLVARILYWDACGQFYFETCGCDIPVQILEELIAEARQSIKIK